MAEKKRILVIEDEPVIAEFLRTGLSYEGYEVVLFARGREGLDYLQANDVSLLILDLMLPDMDGLDVCRQIRNRGLTLPVLMLTARKEVSDRVKGLDTGADDYMTKPFSFDELLARIRALFRRYANSDEDERLSAADIVLNTQTREVSHKGKPLELTPTEFALLELFLRHPRKVFTRETLMNRVMGYDYIGETNIIDVHISHLREKLGDKPPRLIRTVYGVGYAFHPEQAE